jgi:hypothetical protein
MCPTHSDVEPARPDARRGLIPLSSLLIETSNDLANGSRLANLPSFSRIMAFRSSTRREQRSLVLERREARHEVRRQGLSHARAKVDIVEIAPFVLRALRDGLRAAAVSHDG